MPYRRLPNTDVARLRALKQAYQKGKELPPFKLAFTQSTYNKVHAFFSNFETVIRLYKNTYKVSITKSKEYPIQFKKAKLYISHFIQVMNMAIARGEMKPSIRNFYDLEEFDGRVPEMNTESQVIKWGEKIISGETERLKKGMNPITNPTIAKVKISFEQFMESYRSKKINQKNNNRILTDVVKLREKADEIILDVWNEVEKYYSNLPDDEMRKKASEYGISYVYRKNERFLSIIPNS